MDRSEAQNIIARNSIAEKVVAALIAGKTIVTPYPRCHSPLEFKSVAAPKAKAFNDFRENIQADIVSEKGYDKFWNSVPDCLTYLYSMRQQTGWDANIIFRQCFTEKHANDLIRIIKKDSAQNTPDECRGELFRYMLEHNNDVRQARGKQGGVQVVKNIRTFREGFARLFAEAASYNGSSKYSAPIFTKLSDEAKEVVAERLKPVAVTVADYVMADQKFESLRRRAFDVVANPKGSDIVDVRPKFGRVELYSLKYDTDGVCTESTRLGEEEVIYYTFGCKPRLFQNRNSVLDDIRNIPGLEGALYEAGYKQKQGAVLAFCEEGLDYTVRDFGAIESTWSEVTVRFNAKKLLAALDKKPEAAQELRQVLADWSRNQAFAAIAKPWLSKDAETPVATRFDRSLRHGVQEEQIIGPVPRELRQDNDNCALSR